MYDLRTFGDSSSSSASGASRAEMGEVLMRRLKEQAALDLRNSEVELQRILQREQKRHGVLIKQALYGNLQLRKELLSEVLKGQRPIRIEDITGPWIDVTSAVQCLVENSCRIRLHGSSKFSKADLPGFYNPMPLNKQVELSLYVLYSFKDTLHEVTVEDSEDLQLPLKRQLVKDQPRGPFPSSNIPLIFERRCLGASVQTPNSANAMSPRQRSVRTRIKSRKEELYWAVRQHVFLRLVGQGDVKREFHLVLLCASTAALAILWALRS